MQSKQKLTKQNKSATNSIKPE